MSDSTVSEPSGRAGHEPSGRAPREGQGQPPTEPLRRLVAPYHIRFDETNHRNVLRTSVYLAYVQDCAWQHSASLGFDPAWYAAHGLFWLARAVDLRVVREAATYETLAVSTEVTAMRRVWARRQSEVRDEAGELLATAEIDWVMTNARGVPSRIPAELLEVFAVPATFEPQRVVLGPEPEDAVRLAEPVRRQDLDPMAHLNNTHYLDYLEEAVEAAGDEASLARTPRRYRLEYLAPAAPRTRPMGTTWPTAEGRAYRLSAEDGSQLLRALLEG